ncbi:hypothetical protein LJC71_08225 [Desulfosarcina sp. OttesenSCG-928-A07]|nr:hypothetical protein [Desulfosarcina sp. OttesenSCG-928-G17]MDL2329713.1 hypothetical protein [Desulfosarcina sp. OttesenSCG-928-A07]
MNDQKNSARKQNAMDLVMDLIDIKHDLRERKVIPLDDLPLHFRADI